MCGQGQVQCAEKRPHQRFPHEMQQADRIPVTMERLEPLYIRIEFWAADVYESAALLRCSHRFPGTSLQQDELLLTSGLWVFMGVDMVNVLTRHSPDHARDPQPHCED